MESNAELARLEEFVNKLLAKYNDLKGQYHATLSTLQERDDECADLKGQIADLTNERSFVGERVAGLIGQIEQWESNEQDSQEQDFNEQDSLASEDHEDQSGEQGSLFEDESESN